MAGVRVASFNVENLFARPKAFESADWTIGAPILAAYREFNEVISHPVYSPADKQRMRELLVELDIYSVNSHGAVRRRLTQTPKWAWLRKNRGAFDRQPGDATKDVEITANGRADWIGWVELATETTDELGTRMTARVIHDVDADIIGVIEAEDRPSLVRFNTDLLSRQYRHVMLVDGNDDRGIDVGIMSRQGFPIQTITSNVDAVDAQGTIFSRDCPQFEFTTPAGTRLHVLVNHFKSQSGGGGPKRRRQAEAVRRIVDGLVAEGRHVIVMGDLNEGPAVAEEPPVNLKALFDPAGPLISCFDLPGFDTVGRPGTFDSCGLGERFDYVLLSAGLTASFAGGEVFRKGLWGTRKTRPDNWETYADMQGSVHQASDHAAVVVNLGI